MTITVDPRCRVRHASIRLKRHVGPITDRQHKAMIATTAGLMSAVVPLSHVEGKR